MRHDVFWGGVGRWLLPFLLLGVISACGGSTTPQEEPLGADPGIEGMPMEQPKGDVPVAQKPAPIEIPDGEFADVGSAAPSDFNPDDYSAVLDVTKELELHQKGDLRVWIGMEDFVPEDEADMVRKEINFPANEGNFARITPYAPDFKIEPEESQVMRITPSGSSVLFTIIPEKKGEFKISAKIELFDNPYFDGVPIPKTTNIVSVVVRKFVRKKTGFMGDGVESSSLTGGDEATPSESGDITEAPEEPEPEDGGGEDLPDYFDVGDEDKQ